MKFCCTEKFEDSKSQSTQTKKHSEISPNFALKHFPFARKLRSNGTTLVGGWFFRFGVYLWFEVDFSGTHPPVSVTP